MERDTHTSLSRTHSLKQTHAHTRTPADRPPFLGGGGGTTNRFPENSGRPHLKHSLQLRQIHTYNDGLETSGSLSFPPVGLQKDMWRTLQTGSVFKLDVVPNADGVLPSLEQKKLGLIEVCMCLCGCTCVCVYLSKGVESFCQCITSCHCHESFSSLWPSHSVPASQLVTHNALHAGHVTW